MTISELAKQLGLSPHTLRYYEKIGLIRNVERIGSRRTYTKQDRLWLEFIKRLKATGMPLKQILRYSELRYAGAATITERKTMLLSHRQDLEQNIKKLQRHLVALDQKIKTYEALEAEHDTVRKGTRKA
ncbi:MerR family transcriptional regulator [uncultured Pseudodesulfovibrio sp.]|uniref:MerR family transcriptional regulator n=1 Tax=uncultured Pseudodesulfovibrio sp. TaxID=2035858 RepID=UPI0029C6AB20|nr:MerR family transcriptional regulator [uncultured Pseudodesulfovibrio sp.]